MKGVQLGQTIPMSEDQIKKKSAQFNQLILSSLKPRVGMGTQNMLTELASEATSNVRSASFAADTGTDYSSAPINCNGKKSELMVGWIDEIFDCFQQFQFEFNKTATADLQVNVLRPLMVRETVTTRASERLDAHFFKGVLQTPEWAMVLRGQNELIEVFMVPTAYLERLSSNSSIARFLIMLPCSNAGAQPAWRIGSDVISWSDVRHFAKQLFGCLIKLTKGELNLTAGTDMTSPSATPTGSAAGTAKGTAAVPGSATGSAGPAQSASARQPLRGTDAVARLREQTAASEAAAANAALHSAADSSALQSAHSADRAAPVNQGTADSLQALLERNRKKHEIMKLTGRTKVRMKEKFGSTLEHPNEQP